MKTNKVHRSSAGAMAATSRGSAHLSLSNHQSRPQKIDGADDASSRNFENFKMALFFNEIQSRFGKK